ncbi:MvaI/BcnI family restriction endonuclease [Elizabethkingia anophelis]|uniref:MvaI/BcnI family restriction endonuclease n=1 Tax=Elizabethkingia anophelis TaxID=1117645 RepID=UPI0011EB6C14|nr:MvaI/BcnI family restriction endonuclease [Elizabethkingia anophelis]MCT3773360.1 MvaI/BcnI restriction endonuclease family protein [Elizabethkingia anophelis]MCT4182098.1 MvaI/BcnI restriction endonuclease family protein [Elizabethkingia anophelis]MCT4272308.1 MvaI/BcnI restriction endonuclease family protein [Elizabethkingia anophelis]MCT4289876.1 MvaI/BcnI restriction endonuclease family protein [Elizabethkingia anophelis]TYT29979.1 MvaI/BcnI restriction endonuclease family protein [Eliz
MRQLTEVEIERIKLLTEKSVEVALIEPTATGLGKSILDATGSVRAYLKAQNIHDYGLQQQGPDHKVVVNSYLITSTGITDSVASLYRPNTKKGDPRIWFKGLGAYANANDILGIVVYDNDLYVINITQLNLHALVNSVINNPLKELVNEISSLSREVADELLALLNNIASKGAIPAMLQADTAIGRTLETLLGIDINSSKKPDYKGIELKSYRDKRGNRKNLFAQVPDWADSKFKSSAEILDAFGYPRGDDFKLYCTVSSLVHNSQGLKLKLDTDLRQLIEHSDKATIGDFVVWGLETLHKRLLEKHSETFWIGADSLMIDGKEHFIYKKVEHTKKPIVSQFDILLEQGIITLDHLIKRTPAGRVVEKGPLFKIKPNGLSLLFPPSQLYTLI